MNKFFLLILLIFFFSSCCTPRRCPYLGHTDSVYVEKQTIITTRDTIVEYIIPDSTAKAILSSADTSHLETQVAMSDAWIGKDGRLQHTLTNKTVPLRATIEIPQTTTLEKKYLQRTIIKEVEKKLTSWQSFIMVMGKLLLCLCGLGLLYFVFIIMRKFRIFGL